MEFLCVRTQVSGASESQELNAACGLFAELMQAFLSSSKSCTNGSKRVELIRLVSRNGPLGSD